MVSPRFPSIIEKSQNGSRKTNEKTKRTNGSEYKEVNAVAFSDGLKKNTTPRGVVSRDFQQSSSS